MHNRILPAPAEHHLIIYNERKPGMDPFDQEPVRPADEQVLTPARIAATAAAALPAVGLGLLRVSQGLSEVDAASRSCTFHLVFGATLLVLFLHVALIIRRSKKLSGILFAGVLGFVAAFAAAAVVDVGGPPALAAMVVGVVLWGIIAWRRPVR